MFCFHKWDEVKDGYQYCKKCGKARKAPEPKCDHEWEEYKSYKQDYIDYDSRGFFIINIMKCHKCGEMKKNTVRV